MLQRLYVHNFRCLENFEFKAAPLSSALLIGKNGAGKSTIARVLRIFQQLGQTMGLVSDLVRKDDFSLGRADVPMRFEIEVLLGVHRFVYAFALEQQGRLAELGVLEERLELDGGIVFDRRRTAISLKESTGDANFEVDGYVLAFPILVGPHGGASSALRDWLGRMVILAPSPPSMTGVSRSESLFPQVTGENFASWVTGLLAQYPSAYTSVRDYLKRLMPDFGEIRNVPAGKDARNLRVWFEADEGCLDLDFADLSDGEKCQFLCAVVLAANKAYGPLLVFWDEPDNYLALSEVRHFVMALRRGFDPKGQLLATSHNESAIRCFSPENTFLLSRKSHLEPAVVRSLAELPVADVARALQLDDLED